MTTLDAPSLASLAPAPSDPAVQHTPLLVRGAARNNDSSQFLSPGLSLRSGQPVSPLPSPTHAAAAKRPRPRCSQQALAVAAVLEDMMDVNAETERVPDDSLFDDAICPLPEDMDALLEDAAPSASAAVCAVVYAARIDHSSLPLAPENIYGIVAAALAMGALYVDGPESGAACARVARAAGISHQELSRLIARLIDHLPNKNIYISLASFREFHDLLDTICC